MNDVTLPAPSSADHARGPSDAPVTLTEYGDFECPYCSEAHSVVTKLEKHFAGRLRFVFRHFPLRQIHRHAEAAAEAAEAAGVQGRFWEMYDLLFAHQKALAISDLTGYARTAGVADGGRFERELAAGEYRSKLDAALEDALNAGVEGTPTFFINGLPFEEDPTFEALSEAIEAAAA